MHAVFDFTESKKSSPNTSLLKRSQDQTTCLPCFIFSQSNFMPWPWLQQQVACRCNLKISCSLSTQFVSFLTWSFPFTTMWDTSTDPPIQSFCCLCKPGYMRELISPGIALGQWQKKYKISIKNTDLPIATVGTPNLQADTNAKPYIWQHP